MSLHQWFDLLLPLATWVAILTAGMRNRRVLGAFALLTILWYVADVLPDPLWRVTRIALGIAVLLVFLWPDRIGLTSRDASRAHTALQRAQSWVRAERLDVAKGQEVETSLQPGTFPLPSGDWGLAARLIRRAVRLRIDGNAFRDREVRSLMTAGVDYWWAAVKPDIWTRRPAPDAWDAAAVLHCFNGEFHALVPSQAYESEPIVPVGGWDDAAEDVIRALREVHLGVQGADELRIALADGLSSDLAWARGNKSETATANSAAAAARFVELNDRFHVAVEAALEVRRRRRTLTQRLHLRRAPTYEPVAPLADESQPGTKRS